MRLHTPPQDPVSDGNVRVIRSVEQSGHNPYQRIFEGKFKRARQHGITFFFVGEVALRQIVTDPVEVQGLPHLR